MGDAYLALDAGNSKTVALVVDGGGAVLGRGRGGNGDIYGAASPQDAVQAVLVAVGAALADAGLTAEHIVSAAFRIAGVDYPEDARYWEEHLRETLGAIGRWSILNDGFASLRLIDGTGVGLSIAVGTGPALAARSADGREECSGMFMFDDLGGGGLGNSAFAAVTQAWMGISPPTALTAAPTTAPAAAPPESGQPPISARTRPAESATA